MEPEQRDQSKLSLRELEYVDSSLEILEEILKMGNGYFSVGVRRGRVQVYLEKKEGLSAISEKETTLPAPRITRSTSGGDPASSLSSDET